MNSLYDSVMTNQPPTHKSFTELSICRFETKLKCQRYKRGEGGLINFSEICLYIDCENGKNMKI